MPPKRFAENEVIKGEIREIFDTNHSRYGSIRIQKVLLEKGIKVNRKRVTRLMREMGLFPKGTSYHYKNYTHRIPEKDVPNLLNQVFKAAGKNEIWVGDITYIPTKTRTLYLAVFVDIFSRKVVGWSMDTRMKDHLVIDAFLQAIGKEHPSAGLVVHTDHGSQLTSAGFRSLLSGYGAIHSESRKGNPYDNALMESFYRTIKRELIQDADFTDPEQARAEIFKYIETYYNTKRMHSALGYMSPVEFEAQHS